ncbi:MAG: DUF2304 domain-containing protein [Bacteroidia bacterium]|nr:DUF2304 domain-containing protein [Bacteroidia bacterium]
MENNIIITHRIQIIAILTSIVLLGVILNLIRKKRIKEEYSLLWLFFGIIFLVFSIWQNGLDFVAKILGISYPPAALFIVMLLSLFLILIEYSTIISRLSSSNKNLAQEIALLKLEIEKMKEKSGTNVGSEH